MGSRDPRRGAACADSRATAGVTVRAEPDARHDVRKCVQRPTNRAAAIARARHGRPRMTSAADERSRHELRAMTRVLARHGRGSAGAAATIAAALLIESGFGALVPVVLARMIDRTIPQRLLGELVALLALLGLGAILVSFVGVARDYLYAPV